MRARKSVVAAVLPLAAIAAVCVAMSAPAESTFPGKNGRIAYAKHQFFWTEGGSDEGLQLESLPDVWTINPDGSTPLPFALYAEEPRFSPGGGLVAFQDYLWRIFVKPISGSRGRKWRLAPRLGADSFEFTPAWAPFRGRLIFSLEGLDDDDVYLRTIATNGRRMHRLRLGIEPDWSITNRIVFGRRTQSPRWRPGGGHLRRLRAGWVAALVPRRTMDCLWARPRPRAFGYRDHAGGRVAPPQHCSRTLDRFARLVAGRSAHCVCAPEPQEEAEKIMVVRTDGRGRHAILTVRRRPHLADSDLVLQDLDWQPLPF